jgi:long-chain acyl-CoA synthetase
MVLAQHDAVSQVFVFGDSMQSFLVGVVVINEATFGSWCKEHGFEGSNQTLVSKKEVCAAIQVSLDEFGKRNGLHSFECLKKIHLEVDPFTQENGLLVS